MLRGRLRNNPGLAPRDRSKPVGAEKAVQTPLRFGPFGIVRMNLRELFGGLVELTGEGEQIDKQTTSRRVVRIGSDRCFLESDCLCQSTCSKCLVRGHGHNIPGCSPVFGSDLWWCQGVGFDLEAKATVFSMFTLPDHMINRLLRLREFAN